jgi:hypothetical protein
MFCWPCSILNRYSRTNVMHILFSLLRVHSLYIFRALLAHPQEALHKQQLVYCLRVMAGGCTRSEVELVSPTPGIIQTICIFNVTQQDTQKKAPWWWRTYVETRRSCRMLLINYQNSVFVGLLYIQDVCREKEFSKPTRNKKWHFECATET